MKKISAFVLAFLIAVSSCALSCFALDMPEIASQSAYLVDIETGEAVFEQNADQRVTMGTLSKIMVALLALENIEDLDTEITVSTVAYNNAVNKGNGGPNAFLAKGETRSADDLIAILMVKSGLDASNALGEYIAGSLTEFVAMMNAKAAELGCTSTNFVNASGAENASQYTTARDMAIILAAALKNERFAQYANLINVAVPSIKNGDEVLYPSHAYTTSNKLTVSSSEEYYYNAAKGVAYTQLNDNTNSIATVLSKGSSSYICVVLGGGVNSANLKECFLDAKALGQWVFSAFKTVTLAEKDAIVCDTAIELCEQADRLNLIATEDVLARVYADVDPATLRTEVEYYKTTPLVAPVTKGEPIAKMVYYDADGTRVAEVELAAALSLEYSQRLANERARAEFMRSPLFLIIVGAAVLVLAAIVAIVVILYKRNHVDGFRR